MSLSEGIIDDTHVTVLEWGDHGGFNNGHANQERPPPVERYIPQDEETEDQLFSSEHGVSTGINFEKYSEIPCEVTGGNAPAPIAKFEDSGLRNLLLDNIRKSNYTNPTPVQKHAIPIIMEGHDLMACAQTGSGKTAAFLLPILNYLLKENLDSSAGISTQTPQAIVMSPTRELAMQIKDEGRKFASGSIIQCKVVYGGASSGYQLAGLEKHGCNVLVATPGRLLDFLDRGKISFEKVKFVVLDEADRMLDMGFMPDIERMMRHTSMPDRDSGRQTLMFSATFPKEIQEISREYLRKNYLFLKVGMVGGVCADVAQTIFQVS